MGAGGLLLFNGKELQTYADLNFYDYHWRQYDPQLGRWHSPDPADQFHGISGYAYCANNPVMLTDPDGRAIPLLVFVGAAIVGGGLNVWNNKEKIRDVWSGLAYFGVGAAGGAMAVVNPKAGFAIASLGNVGVDIATGNVPTFEKWQDVAGYGFSTGLNALDVVGAGQTVKWGYNAAKSWITTIKDVKFLGKNAITESWKGGFAVQGAAVEVIGHKTSLLSKFTPFKITQEAASKIIGGNGLPSLRSMQTGLRNPASIDALKKSMLDETFEYTQIRGQIAGYYDKGIYIIGDGNHRMVAALELFKETGNSKYVMELLKNGKWINKFEQSRPMITSRTFWGRFRNYIGF